MTIRILSGAGRYDDPWHDFGATTAEVAAVLRERSGAGVEIRTDVEEAMADLDGVELLVVNVGNPTRHGLDSSTFAAAEAGFERYLARDAPVWALHVAAASFPGMPAWERALGGRWVGGASMHPPIGDARVLVPESDHPIVAGLGDFTVWDERYTHLRVADAVRPLAFHRHEGAEHPLLWTLEDGRRRAAYDALGHTVESYRHPSRREILDRTLDWLVNA
ncbi:ThuA domain-containing protein [Agromyces intestinalis]|uniref:ThuA domain-containing protein n=1 Tax=Agromyces intestinalis TaxID=2592652 RepID=A0A5C1YE94_9MICO|nr:ThuA domain-containing protein [Agromyces intestinalis]QEO14441.1 ThuA domain-containing protein [Agromyces intestinalis]